MSLPTKVDIVEVGTRDGLQNEKQYITPEDKIKLLDTITDAGVRRIEVTSFVSPKHVPQMRDAQEVLAGCKRNPDTEYEALVPNVRGMERALACELDGVMLFVAASETFNQKNIRASREEMLGVAREVAKMAKGANLKLRGGVVATFGCPYEGRISYEDVADTVGMSNPAEIKRLTEHIRNKFPSVRYALHLHNTRGSGLANLLAGLEVGIDTFDTSIGGLGGCPFAPRATGNISSEDTINMLHEMGIETGIDLPKLLEAVAHAEKILDRQLPGQLLHAGIPEWEMAS